jgi:hypothetical protein
MGSLGLADPLTLSIASIGLSGVTARFDGVSDAAFLARRVAFLTECAAFFLSEREDLRKAIAK